LILGHGRIGNEHQGKPEASERSAPAMLHTVSFSGRSEAEVGQQPTSNRNFSDCC